MKCFIATLLLVASATAKEIEVLIVSDSCGLHSDQVALITCLNPFLEKWEMIRSGVAAPGNIIIPVLHYTRDELLTLCDMYTQVSGYCFGQQVMDKCRDNTLVTAVRSLGEYVCEIRKPQVQSRFECISAALTAKPECREMIRGIPKPELSNKKCHRMEEFFTCLHAEIYDSCGVWGVGILVQAVDSIGCMVPVFTLTEKGKIEIVKNPSKRTRLEIENTRKLEELKNMTWEGNLDKFAAIPEDPRIPEFLHNVRVDPVEAYYKAVDVGLIPHWSLNDAFFPTDIVNGTLITTPPPTFPPWNAEAEFSIWPLNTFRGHELGKEHINLVLVSEGTVRTSRTCDLVQDDKALAPCIAPWFRTWLSARSVHAPPALLFFPVLFYTPLQILELCDSYVELLDSCLTSKIMETCRQNQLIAFIRSHVGYICSVRGVNILSHFNCLADAVTEKPECRRMIESLSVTDIQESRCKTMPQFFECMEPIINQKCGSKGIAILVQAIDGFGCDINDMKKNLLDVVEDEASRESLATALELDTFGTLPRYHPAAREFARLRPPKQIPKNKKRFRSQSTTTESPSSGEETAIHTSISEISLSPSPPSVGPPSFRPPERQAVLKSVISVPKTEEIQFFNHKKASAFPEPAKFEVAEPVPEPETTPEAEPTTKLTEPITKSTQRTTKRTEPTTKRTEITTKQTEPTTEQTEPPTKRTTTISTQRTRKLTATTERSVEGPKCTQDDEIMINECFVPLNHKWSDMIEATPDIHDIVFPLFRYGKWDIYELCTLRAIALRECLNETILRNCKRDPIIEIVNELLEYACGRDKTFFFQGYECIHEVEMKSPECYQDIVLPPTPGLSKEEKCFGIPSYVHCMTDRIESLCPASANGSAVLRSAVQQFGCEISPDSESKEDTFAVTAGPMTTFEIPGTTESGSIDEIETTTVSTTTDRPVVTYHCGKEVQKYVTSCMLPLVGTWLSLRAEREILSNYSFPLYLYKKQDILSMCDHYANAFLRCDFPIFQACLQYEVVKFSLNHLGYICRPEVITDFFDNYDCIASSLAKNAEKCNRYIEASSEPVDRCSGLPEFYQCGRGPVRSECGKEAVMLFRQSMQEMGCRVVPTRQQRHA